MKTTLSVTLAMFLLLLFTVVPAVAQEGPDEWESNDEMDLADYIDGLVIEGEIGRQGDTDDWFVLDGQEGYNPTIILYYDDDRCDIDLEVYSDDDYVGSLTSTMSPDEDDFEIPGECYIHVYIYDGHGDYTIEIDPGGGGGHHGGSNRDCEGPDEWEPNDDWDLADYIDGYEIDGYACEGDDDWYVLDGQEGYYPEITLYYDDYDCDIDLEVYSDDDYVGSLSSTSSPDWDDFEIPGECYLHVYSYDGEGEYSIEINPGDGGGHSGHGGSDCEGPDEWESNDDWDLADFIDGYTIDGYCCEGDDDWFVLDGQEGTRPTITIYYDDRHCDLDVEIYSDDEYIGSLTSTSSPDYDDFRIPGECYIHVYSFDGEGEYTIEIDP